MPSADNRIYLDHAATTPMRQVAIDAFVEHAHLLNPGGQYASGRAARRVLETARETVAQLLGCEPIEVIFCASGTEADNLAMTGLARAGLAAGRDTIVSSGLEHPAVAKTVEDLTGRGMRSHALDVVGAVADVAGFASSERDRDFATLRHTAVATLQWANNETGAKQPVGELIQLAADCGQATGITVPVHVDAVQAVGHEHVNFHQLGCTTLAASGHKFGGPRAMGLLLARRSPAPQPVLLGGGQERGIRPGTVNVAGAAALAAALTEARQDIDAENQRLSALRGRLIAAIQADIPDVVVHTPENALAGHVHVSIPGAEGDSLIMLLDMAGFEASTGSACASGVNRASEVLLSMGVPTDIARGAIRFTLGRTTCADDVEALIRALPGIAAQARSAGMA
ncbi:cysteine desulfurase family protein [Corynebacterium aquilae]|uniref:Cysteine desulfurase n=1 Tax=Corynebacterium aquilae DSM 44791 TaxID=1431546 RepID=A0A1L7CFF8_9CORY|nr:cysteine desulfurase family protein [Corynebacterium aquilae]APT84579.1 cysteine desulfurase [Corynebacterium aquilae DSM 44791]